MTYRDIMASCAACESIGNVLGINGLLIKFSFFVSLRLKILLIVKLVKLLFVFPDSDAVDSAFVGEHALVRLSLRQLWLDIGDRFCIGVEVRSSDRESVMGCGDGSGLDTTSISSSRSWIDIFFSIIHLRF